jgi:hypothetical protein
MLMATLIIQIIILPFIILLPNIEYFKEMLIMFSYILAIVANILIIAIQFLKLEKEEKKSLSFEIKIERLIIIDHPKIIKRSIIKNEKKRKVLKKPAKCSEGSLGGIDKQSFRQ